MLPVRREIEKTQFGYEVQYLLDAPPAAVDTLRTALDELGDSLVIVGTGEGDPPTWNVHVHVDDIGAAIEAGVRAGRPHRIAVTRLEDRLHAEEHEPVRVHTEPAHDRGSRIGRVPGAPSWWPPGTG